MIAPYHPDSEVDSPQYVTLPIRGEKLENVIRSADEYRAYVESLKLPRPPRRLGGDAQRKRFWKVKGC